MKQRLTLRVFYVHESSAKLRVSDVVQILQSPLPQQFYQIVVFSNSGSPTSWPQEWETNQNADTERMTETVIETESSTGNLAILITP